jgi:phosphate starvation-inducible PhoH-like protein
MESLVSLETIRRMEENRTLEIAPLAYMRGRTLSDCFLILDEAQNTTKEQMKMFLTRIGEGSKTVVTGDITQIDLPKRQNSGLLNVIRVLEKIQEIEFVFLGEEDVVRHPLVRKIVRAYQDHEQA